jgi:oligopeptide transport system ATP-binding protein
MTPLLDVRNLHTRFRTSEGVIQAVDGISFTVEAGETVAIVGESGSGKSVSMLSVQRLLPPNGGRVEEGEVWFRGKDLLRLDRKAMRKINGAGIGMIFQDPMSSLNPLLSVGFQIAEALREHLDIGRKEAMTRVVELLERVGIPQPQTRIGDYPHQFSGGMRQRVMIAMALSCSPALLVADEPTTALDVTIQAQILRLMKQLRAELDMSLIWISHDLGVVAKLADRVIVMYAGRIVEEADVHTFYRSPRHPYSKGLLDSLPRFDDEVLRPLRPIPGQPPNLAHRSPGCAFAPRCSIVQERCRAEAPPLVVAGADARMRVACWRADEAGMRNAK